MEIEKVKELMFKAFKEGQKRHEADDMPIRLWIRGVLDEEAAANAEKANNQQLKPTKIIPEEDKINLCSENVHSVSGHKTAVVSPVHKHHGGRGALDSQSKQEANK